MEVVKEHLKEVGKLKSMATMEPWPSYWLRSLVGDTWQPADPHCTRVLMPPLSYRASL